MFYPDGDFVESPGLDEVEDSVEENESMQKPSEKESQPVKPKKKSGKLDAKIIRPKKSEDQIEKEYTKTKEAPKEKKPIKSKLSEPENPPEVKMTKRDGKWVEADKPEDGPKKPLKWKKHPQFAPNKSKVILYTKKWFRKTVKFIRKTKNRIYLSPLKPAFDFLGPYQMIILLPLSVYIFYEILKYLASFFCSKTKIE